MSDNVENSNARLEKLVRRIMKEKDPVEFDKLCSELWLVLNELKGLERGRPSGRSKYDGRVIPIRLLRWKLEVCLWLKKEYIINIA